ncbi:MAG: DUF4142 domain-containing protein [Bacteroidota bacterium]
MMIRKNLFVIAAMCLCMACGNQRSEEMEADFNMEEHSKAHGSSSDDIAAGRGDTSLHDGSKHGGEQGALHRENHTTPATTTTPAQPVMSDANIFEKLSLSDTKEIEEGKTGVKMATNADVKKYAQMLVTMHTKMKNDGATLAKKLAITPTPAPNENVKMMMEQSLLKLNGMTKGTAFDKEFIMMQIDGHQKTLAAVNMMETHAQNAEVKALLAKVKPVVQSHIDQAKTIAEKLK